LFSATVNGLAPASGGGTANFLRADGTWSTPTAAVAGVTSFNTRTGAVTLAAGDVTAVGGALLASPNFSGTPQAPTQAPGTSNTTLATTAFVEAAISAIPPAVASFNTRTGAVTLSLSDVTAVGGASIASPSFSGAPLAPTPAAGSSNTQIATTAFVAAAITALPANVASFNTRTGAVTLTTGDVTAAGGAPVANPTFTGTVTLAADPTTALQAATKQYVDTLKNVPVGYFWAGKPAAATSCAVVFTNAMTLPANFAGSHGLANAAATASATFTVFASHAGGAYTNIGTINIAAGARAATFPTIAATTFAAGDALMIQAPGTPDTTLTDIAITIQTTRN
jgi:hypothetical protein